MFGEVLEPNQETVNLVEEIVREQVVEIVRLSSPDERQKVTLFPDKSGQGTCHATRTEEF